MATLVWSPRCARGVTSGTGASRSRDEKRGRGWVGGQRALRWGQPAAPEETYDSRPPGPRVAGLGSLRNRDCGERAPRMLSVVLLFWGRRPKLFFSLVLCLPKQETVVLCCHYFFFF